MIHFLATLLCTCFSSLAALHFYWAIGGHWGFQLALPQDDAGDTVFSPNALACILVGLGLSAMAFFYGALILPPHWDPLPLTWRPYVGWGIVGLFVLRGIGDFRYVGLFRKIRQTDFAQLDRRFYTPLCWALAVLGALVQWGG